MCLQTAWENQADQRHGQKVRRGRKNHNPSTSSVTYAVYAKMFITEPIGGKELKCFSGGVIGHPMFRCILESHALLELRM